MVKRVSVNDQRSINRWIARLGRYRRLPSKRKTEIAVAQLRLRYRYLGHGTHRLVYDLGNGLILKVPITSRGIRCNELEYRMYASCAKSIKQHLCPVVGYGRGWILMRKMKALAPFTRKYHKQLKLFRTRLKKARIRPSDLKRSNLAVYKGKIVVVDYGHFQAPHLRLIKPAAKPVTTPARQSSITDPSSFEQPAHVKIDIRILKEWITASDNDPACPAAEVEADSYHPADPIE